LAVLNQNGLLEGSQPFLQIVQVATIWEERQGSDNFLFTVMLDFGIHVEIKAPAERVWAVMRDIERWPEWTPTVTKIGRIGDGALAVESRAVIWQPKLRPGGK
jgi:hypothetical protein